MVEHLRVAFHVPSKSLCQETLDTVLECTQRMALQQNKGGRRVYLVLDNALGYGPDEGADFTVRLDNKR